MPVIENGVGREVLCHFAEAGLQAWLTSGTADAGFGVADDAGGTVDDAGVDERPDGQVGSGRIAAWIGDQLRSGNPLAAEFRQPIDGLGEERWLGMFGFVPGFVAGGGTQAESAAKIDDADTCIEEPGRELHGRFGRCGEKHNVEFRVTDRFASAGKLSCFGRAPKFRSGWAIFAMLEEYGSRAGVLL